MLDLASISRRIGVVLVALAVVAAAFAAVALADEVFQPRAWVEPYAEGKHSATGLVDIVQGEGWQYESCIDVHTESGQYVEKECKGPGVAEERTPHDDGYARVWNAKGGRNEIWGWARF